MRYRKLGSSDLEISEISLGAIDEVLRDAPVKKPTLAPLARAGVTHR
jgi:aryl-alcohol dehydrogenase-like predicted oxidoreductase